MKTLSVKQVADVLGVSSRAILKRLTNGQLKGTRRTNKYGVEEWWIYPNKEITEALRRTGSALLSDSAQGHEDDYDNQVLTATQDHPQIETLAARVQELEAAINRSPVDSGASFKDGADSAVILDAIVTEGRTEGLEAEREIQGNDERSGDRLAWRDESLEKKMQETIDLFMKPLIEKVQTLTLEVAEKDKMIEEQKTQLLLLPDFEKQKADLLKRIEEERRAAEIQHAKVSEKEEEAQRLAAENERLREEAEAAKKKAEEVALSLEKLQLIEKQMEILKRPWWKKWLVAAPNDNV